ncbi:MAG: hypothetical protein AB7I30_11815, partial [Isosphaeraceae bacterium]
LHVFDCRLERAGENHDPVTRSGFQWVLAAELSRLRFPEANLTLLEELARGSVPASASASEGT